MSINIGNANKLNISYADNKIFLLLLSLLMKLLNFSVIIWFQNL